jgi:hypothetical protein
MPKIKVSSSFSGKIPTGSFQNSAPGFHAEVELETGLEGEALEREIDSIQKSLHGLCYQNFKIVADAARVEKIKSDLKSFRFYPTPYGDFPSVTTIIDPDFKAFVGEDELKVAISEGNICHARAAHYIKTGQWVDVKELEGIAPDLLVCKGKFLDAWDFPGFLKKYPLTDMKNGVLVVNQEHRYAGTPDGEGLYPLGGEKGADVVPTIFDFKRTPDKEKNFIQMAAYAKCLPHIKQMMIIPTNPDNQQGFQKPILSSGIDKFFEVFIQRRKDFLATYGI